MINDELNQINTEEIESGVLITSDIPKQSPIVSFIVRLFLAVWILSYLTFALSILVNTWAHNNQGICDYFQVKVCENLSPIFVSAFHAMIGGVLGAGVLGLTSFHRHVSIEKNFNIAHTWGYIFAPWLSIVLGLAVFVLLQSGLLIFSGEMSASDEVSIQNLAYLGIGFLSGFGWYDATRRIQKIVKNFFSEKEENVPKETIPEGAQIIVSEIPVEEPNTNK